MNHSQNLHHGVINQMTEDMTGGNIPSPLPSQSGLVEIYNINCTTVHHILQHSSACGVLTLVRENYVITHKPEQNDGFDCTAASLKEQNCLFKQAFFAVISLRQLRAGEDSSKLQLTRAANISPVVVREYPLKFGHYSLIQNGKRNQQSMKQFDQSYAKQLFELREMLETHSLQYFLNLPGDGPRWLQVKAMFERYRTLHDSAGSNFRMFSQLDRDLHAMLLSVANNIFFNQSLEIISVIFHFHYQRDESDLRQRNIIAIGEHMTILSVLIYRGDLDATTALRSHLGTAKQSMIRPVKQYHR